MITSTVISGYLISNRIVTTFNLFFLPVGLEQAKKIVNYLTQNTFTDNFFRLGT